MSNCPLLPGLSGSLTGGREGNCQRVPFYQACLALFHGGREGTSQEAICPPCLASLTGGRRVFQARPSQNSIQNSP